MQAFLVYTKKFVLRILKTRRDVTSMMNKIARWEVLLRLIYIIMICVTKVKKLTYYAESANRRYEFAKSHDKKL